MALVSDPIAEITEQLRRAAGFVSGKVDGENRCCYVVKPLNCFYLKFEIEMCVASTGSFTGLS